MTDLTCDVCGQEPALGVASSPFGAISFAYGAECLKKPAEVEFMFAYLWYDVANKDIDALIPEVKQWFTFKDGKYITFEEWVEWAKTQPDPAPPEYTEEERCHLDSDDDFPFEDFVDAKPE